CRPGETMTAATWNVLHDGRITSAAGVLPGNLRLIVHIGYLCDLLPTNGKQLVIDLQNCESIAYQSFDGSSVIDPCEVAALGLEILNASTDGQSMVVECADGSYGGQLYVRYSEAEVATLEGQSLTQADLESAADQYWEAWSRRG